MQNYIVHLETKASDSFYANKAAQSVDLDIRKKLTHHLEVKIDVNSIKNIGVIYGASGTGKTTLAKQMFGNDCFDLNLDKSKCVIDQFSDGFSYEERVAMLNSIGLSQVSCWIKPINTLSNGQQARASAAIAMSTNKQIIVLDEWTSVVDRNVAKAMSHCLQRFARKFNKKIMVCSCHEDILEWLKPDVIINCDNNLIENISQEQWELKKKSHIEFQIREVKRETWHQFSKYHYLNDRLCGGLGFYYGLFLNNKQIGFQAFNEYTPVQNNKQRILHSNRTVVHPDYCGFGLGVKLINCTSKFIRAKGYRVMAKFSSQVVYNSLIKSESWRFVRSGYLTPKVSDTLNKSRNKSTRNLVKYFCFEFVD